MQVQLKRGTYLWGGVPHSTAPRRLVSLAFFWFAVAAAPQHKSHRWLVSQASSVGASCPLRKPFSATVSHSAVRCKFCHSLSHRYLLHFFQGSWLIGPKLRWRQCCPLHCLAQALFPFVDRILRRLFLLHVSASPFFEPPVLLPSIHARLLSVIPGWGHLSRSVCRCLRLAALRVMSSSFVCRV